MVEEVHKRMKELGPSVWALREAPFEFSGRSFSSTKSTEPSATLPPNLEKEIGSVAGEIVAVVLDKLGKGLASSLSATSEPGPSARIGEKFPGRGAVQAARSGKNTATQTDLPACNWPFCLTCMEKVAEEAVESVGITLESFVHSQVCDYAKMAVYNVLAIIRKQLEEESNQKADALWGRPEEDDTLASGIVDSVLGQCCQRLTALPSDPPFARCVADKRTPSGKEASPARGTLRPQGRKIPVRKLEKIQPRTSLPPINIPGMAVYSEEETESEEEMLCDLLPSVLQDCVPGAQTTLWGIHKSTYWTTASTASSPKTVLHSLPKLRPGSTSETLPIIGQAFPRKPFPPPCAKPPSQRARLRRPVREAPVPSEPEQAQWEEGALASKLVEGVLRRCVATGCVWAPSD